MGKTRDIFKKTGHTKGTFHTKMGKIKDRNCMNLTEAEDIKKRWQEHTEEPHKNDLHDPYNHSGVIKQLKPHILAPLSGPQEGSLQTKLVVMMEFQLSYFKS